MDRPFFDRRRGHRNDRRVGDRVFVLLGQAQAFGEQEAEAKRDAAKDIAKGESEYIFRRQFALDRPVIWNGWTGLGEAEVREAILAAGIRLVFSYGKIL